MRSRRDRGVALLLALLLLLILIILVGQMVVSVQHTRSVAENATDDLRDSYGLKAGYYQARLYLEADAERGQEADSLDEMWAQPIDFELGGATVKVRIVDAGSKINLAQMVNDKGEANQAVVDQFDRLLANLQFPSEVALRVLDYEDADTRGDYEAGARNGRMTSLDELLRIEGIGREVLFGDEGRPKGILKFVTLWPQEGAGGTINVNTAPVEVLEALDKDMTATTALAIEEQRGQKSADGYDRFTKVSDLGDVRGMTPEIMKRITPLVTVKATAFEIHVRSTAGAVEKAWVYVVSRGSAGKDKDKGTSTGTAQIKLIGRQREPEGLSVKPPEKEE